MVISNYNGPKHVVEAFLDLNLDKNTRILDVLAGSGLVAKLVSTTTIIIFDINMITSKLQYKCGFFQSYLLTATPTSMLSTAVKTCWVWQRKRNPIRISTFHFLEESMWRQLKLVSTATIQSNDNHFDTRFQWNRNVRRRNRQRHLRSGTFVFWRLPRFDSHDEEG